MLELILVRHGETDSNIRGTHLGWTDIPLNQEGFRQVNSLAEKYKDQHFDRIYCSPLIRTKQTADAINKYHQIEINYLEGLKERNFGIWEDLVYNEIKDNHTELHDAWIKDWIDFKIPDGESAREAFERAETAINQIISKHQEGRVLVVTHLGAIRFMLASLLGMGIEGSWHFRMLNAAAARVEITEGYSVLVALNER